jgi:uncharacterized protein
VIELAAHAEGVVLPVRAQAGARANAIRGEQEGALKVAVTQIAEKGKANKAIIDLLCKSLSLKRSQVTLIAGETSPQKRFLIRGISASDLADRTSRFV